MRCKLGKVIWFGWEIIRKHTLQYNYVVGQSVSKFVKFPKLAKTEWAFLRHNVVNIDSQLIIFISDK